ncbi:restriction endonuclease subunit S [Pseudomonas aeruginosa]|nr:restriction endonuclease subunit S [Pseudomonas aeruginosa]HBP5953970.1 restriction endonuclease subunit S [Pseudomonas aeruginosa]HBP6057376.1 restriction endonuclease subunit S [Pseudomonas aeruginosa]HBP6170911.1 restriction endonuclease subunit S [Pseudomonas aeruginosa]HBP6205618.1 restriction endonuclease subunit S [Pseudomonas aeruginosa]
MVPEGWKQASLASICLDKISYGVVQTGEHVPNGVPCLRVADLPNGRTSEMVKTSETISNSYKRTILKNGDIVLALRGDIGLACLVKSDWVGINITRGVARLSPDDSQVLSDFLLWELRSPRLKGELLRRAGGSALQEISIGELRDITVLIPPLPEQEKIAAVLSTWDKAIALTEQLLDKSRQQKKALMQQLIGKAEGHKEGKNAINAKRIVDIADRIQRKSDGGEHPVLTISSLSGFVRQDEKYSRFMAGKSVENYILLNHGEFAYNKGNSKTYEFGCIFDLSSFETGLVPHVYICFKLKPGLSHRYFKYLFEADYLKPQLGQLVNTGVRNNGLLNIKPSEFMNTKVPVPSLEEQERIADILHVASEQIIALEKRLACLRQEKKALMQQLLTGKRRVKVDEPEVT